MVCRGAYRQALHLVKHDMVHPEVDLNPLEPYAGALLIEVGQLQAAGRILNLRSSNFNISPRETAALLRERAALLLAQGEYERSAAEAIKAYGLANGAYAERVAYTESIAAEALLRADDLKRAEFYAEKSLRAIEKHARNPFFFVPRVFFASCLIESYGPRPEAAEPLCLRGLAIAQKSPASRRDFSLGYLALAEARLKSGKFDASIDAANRSLAITQTLFGLVHQDAVEALTLISLAKIRKGKSAEPEAHSALQLATQVFGTDSKRVAELKRSLQ